MPGFTARSAVGYTPESKMPLASSPVAMSRVLSPPARRASSDPGVDDPPELRPALARARREADQRDGAAEPRAGGRERAPGLGAPELVELGRGHGGGPAERREVGEQLLLLALDAAPRIDHEQHPAQRGPLAEVGLDQRLPRAPLRLRAHREPVAGQVHQHDPLVQREEVELPGPPRRAARARQAAPADERVDERRLTDVRAAGDRDLGRPGRRPAASSARGAEEAHRDDLTPPGGPSAAPALRPLRCSDAPRQTPARLAPR